MTPINRTIVPAVAAAAVAVILILLGAWRLWGVAGPQAPAPRPPVADGSTPPARPAPAPQTQASAPAPAATAPPTPAPAPGPTAAAPAAPPAAPVYVPGAAPADAAAAKQAPAAPPVSSAGAGPAPSFDVVRVAPTGEAVIAGRAAPKARVELLAGDQKMGEAQADADGQFVILPKALAPGDHVLSLRVGEGEAAQTSRQTVAIAVPRPAAAPVAPEGKALAAVAEPGQPTRNLAEPRPAPNELRIGAAEAQEGGGLLLSGVAPAGSQLRLYLNDSYVASATSGADGRWSLKVERGMSAGGYAIRADVIGPDGKPTARAEAPFQVPVALAAKAGRIGDAPARDPVIAAGGDGAGAKASAPAPAAGQVAATETGAAAPSPAQAVVEDLRTAKVARGDSLWRISRTIYGEGMRYTTLYDANTSQIRNPDLIYPGQVLVVPKQEEGRAAPAGPAAPRR